MRRLLTLGLFLLLIAFSGGAVRAAEATPCRQHVAATMGTSSHRLDASQIKPAVAGDCCLAGGTCAMMTCNSLLVAAIPSLGPVGGSVAYFHPDDMRVIIGQRIPPATGPPRILLEKI